jgi:hypothetical protein
MMSERKPEVRHIVEVQLHHGFGDPTAGLSAGEYVSERKQCPHVGCDWTLDVQWTDGASITRWLGLGRIERACQAHLETHLPSMQFLDE